MVLSFRLVEVLTNIGLGPSKELDTHKALFNAKHHCFRRSLGILDQIIIVVG